MKFSPVIFAAVAVVALAPVSAHAKCSRNADVLQGSVLVLNDKGEWCEVSSSDRATFESRREAQFAAEVAAEQKAERAYKLAMVKHLTALTGIAAMANNSSAAMEAAQEASDSASRD